MKEKTQKAIETTQQSVKTARTVATQQRTLEDFKNAALMVSVFVNMFILTSWITLQVTDRYNAQVVSFLFS